MRDSHPNLQGRRERVEREERRQGSGEREERRKGSGEREEVERRREGTGKGRDVSERGGRRRGWGKISVENYTPLSTAIIMKYIHRSTQSAQSTQTHNKIQIRLMDQRTWIMDI